MKPANPLENQAIEWKSAWHDDFLKWICGFANAQGGLLVIGKNDKGETVGAHNAKKLLEDLPNKIRATMGIVVEVNLRAENALDVLEITVPAYPNAISYHGKYYFRSGSTNQELSGYALDELILRKYGRTHDSMPLPRITIGDFWHDAFDVFRKKAVASKRLTPEDVAVTDKELLHSLKLIENDRLLLAAALVFHQTPEQWCLGAYVKIGYFANDAEILYQDELNGALVGMADKVVDTIFTKYFAGYIRYEGLQRIDDYPMPRAALREAVMNALVHRDYSTGSPIQIRVYSDRVYIANDCRLPEGTTATDLATAHKSVTINPLVAGALFRSGQIEAWGRGIERIIKLCLADNLPEPEFIITPRTFTICFHVRSPARGDDAPAIDTKDDQKDDQKDGIKDDTKEITEAVLAWLLRHPSATHAEIAEQLTVSLRTVSRAIKILVETKQILRVGSRRFGHWIMVAQSANTPANDTKDVTKDDAKKITEAVLAWLCRHPSATHAEIAQKLSVSPKTVSRAIKTLVDTKQISRAGGRRFGHWEVVSK